MSIRAIEISCDTPACWAHCSITEPAIDKARQHAAERWGWTHRDGRDICGPCSRGDTPQARGEAWPTPQPRTSQHSATGSSPSSVMTVVQPALAEKDAEIADKSEVGHAVAHGWQQAAAGWRQRAEQAEGVIKRAQDLADEALDAWRPEREHHQERFERKGYSHDEAAAEAYGDAIEAMTGILAALDQPQEASGE